MNGVMDLTPSKTNAKQSLQGASKTEKSADFFTLFHGSHEIKIAQNVIHINIESAKAHALTNIIEHWIWQEEKNE